MALKETQLQSFGLRTVSYCTRRVGIGYLGRVWVIGTEVQARDSLLVRNLGMYPIYNSCLLRFLTDFHNTIQCDGGTGTLW